MGSWYAANYLYMTYRLSKAAVRPNVETACGPGNGVEIIKELYPASTKVYASDIFLRLLRKSG